MPMAILDGNRNALLGLADLACSAAEELDQLANGGESDFRAVRALSEYLHSVSNAAAQDRSDPVISMRLSLVRRAMAGASCQSQELATMEDVLAHAKVVAGKLDESSQPGSPATEMRDFCLALSKVVAAEGRLRMGTPASTRYRK